MGKPLLLSGGGGFLVPAGSEATALQEGAARLQHRGTADWVHCTSAMYLTNNERLDLGLIGHCDVPAADIQTALAKAPAGYYVEGVVKAAAPRAGGGGGAGGATTKR